MSHVATNVSQRIGKVLEGVKQVDTVAGIAHVYARDAEGNWPIFTPAGLPLLYQVCGTIEVESVHPPDTDFDAPEYKEHKAASQKRCAARRRENGHVADPS